MSWSKVQRCFGFYKQKMTNLSTRHGRITFAFARTARDKVRCPQCGSAEVQLYGQRVRRIRDVPSAGKPVYLHIPLNRIKCMRCGVHDEHLSFVDPYARHTRRLEKMIYLCCRMMTTQDVAEALGLSWDEVRTIDHKHLAQKYRKRPWKNLRKIGVDEVAIKKGHTYITIVMNLETGDILYAAPDRTQATLERFFRELGPGRCRRIQAVAMDMWQPYAAAVRHYLPRARIVFDKFHVLAQYGKTLDQIRNTEFKKAAEEDRAIIKGTKYLLLANQHKLNESQQQKLTALLTLNHNLNLAYILKEDLKHLWNAASRTEALAHLKQWVQKARESDIPHLKKFAKSLLRHAAGILNYVAYPLTTAAIEGTNNKIKVLKRKMYGARNIFYFMMKLLDLKCLSPGFL